MCIADIVIKNRHCAGHGYLVDDIVYQLKSVLITRHVYCHYHVDEYQLCCK